MTRAASGSAHDQPSALLATSPTSSTADSDAQIIVCLLSATTLADPSSRPVRRSNAASFASAAVAWSVCAKVGSRWSATWVVGAVIGSWAMGQEV